MRILLIEDDAMIGKAVRQGLSHAGFVVDWVTDGRAAELSLNNGVYDLAVLDLGLPKKDGMAILATLRGMGNSMPVLIASARDTVRDRIAGLEAGADDYVLKPFDLDELVARVRALMRRHAGSGTPLLKCGNLMLDPVRKVVTQAGDAVELSAKEFAVLEALMQRPGAVLSRQALEESVYGWSEEVASNAIEVHLHHLRRKLGATAIKNVRGVGYRVMDV
jgi:two-component system, OmpR family, response regulator QseB